jgi:transcriptional/translational regulatory protein YebC/TACO1
VVDALTKKNFETMSAEISMVAESEISVDKDATAKAVKLIDKLEEDEDVQNVYSNVAIPEGFEAE